MQTGQLLEADFFNSVGGLNTTDTPFKVQDTQATSGTNWVYTQTGGIQKRFGHALINSVANNQAESLGLGVYNSSTAVKFILRAAGTKLQNFNNFVPSFTNLSEDTAAATTDFLPGTSTQQVVTSQFNNGSASVLWAAGGGMSAIYGAYSTSKVTKNGVSSPTNSGFTATDTGSGSSLLDTGTYLYTLVYHKLSTGATSNAGGEASVSVTAGHNVALAWTLTNNDTTKYDLIYIYRSALNGASAFTTGDLIATVASSAVSYLDTGTAIVSSTNIPRAGNVILDNSPLPAGTYNTLAVFKRRLITASGNNLYISDLNKSESWPLTNYLTLPSGGPITGLSVISFTSAAAQTLDELLVIFKERELWVITGNDYTDWVLKFIDNTGCPNQSLLVPANGYLAWVDYRGIYIWQGGGKPIYCSRPIESLFNRDGQLDKSNLTRGVGQFYRKDNVIVWYLSDKVFGVQKYAIKMDLRLTLPGAEDALSGRVMDGVFTQDNQSMAVYAIASYLPTSNSDELLLLGDDSGYIYKGYNSYADNVSTGISFKYGTKFLDLGTPNINKRFHRVIVWVAEVGNWNLSLDYWTAYQSSDSQKATVTRPISDSQGLSTSLWDVANWDSANWDDYALKYRPLVFNLNPSFNNASEGASIKLQFRNENANEPITVAGFSVIYSEKGGVN